MGPFMGRLGDVEAVLAMNSSLTVFRTSCAVDACPGGR
jgi:hypothetical protein